MNLSHDRDFPNAIWRKSTYSGVNGESCVSVAHLAGRPAIRDSKRAGDSPVILVGATQYRDFIAGVRGRVSG
jgi:uncharacterized protein DUF397